MDLLIQEAKNLFNVHLTARQVMSLITYEKELLDWNQKFNLTAIRDVESIRIKHFLDSYSCVLAWQANPPLRLIDVGTGAGFPGIPLKIIYPTMHVSLVESVGKKAMFCQHMVSKLGLEGIEVIQTRAEDIGQDKNHRETYDYAVARAVAGLNILSEYLLPLVKIGGTVLAQKGETAQAEVESAGKAIKTLGGKLNKIMPVQLPNLPDIRYLVLIDKLHTTPESYPRKAGIPSKTPIG